MIYAPTIETGSATAWICITCGTQYPESLSPPPGCPICEDSRQFVAWDGQRWTSLEAIRRTHRNLIKEEDSGLYSIHTQPDFAIGERAFLLQTPEGNILWDCISLLDEETEAALVRLGGIDAIAISHPHYYTTVVEWSRAFGNATVYLHEFERPWVMRPDPVIHFWSGNTMRLFGGVSLIRTGGHFDGYQVLHLPGHDGNGILLAGDQPEVCMDRNWVTFMYSYPNFIPLGRRAVEQIMETLQPFQFERLYAAFPGRDLKADARQIVERSATRYIEAIAE